MPKTVSASASDRAGRGRALPGVGAAPSCGGSTRRTVGVGAAGPGAPRSGAAVLAVAAAPVAAARTGADLLGDVLPVSGVSGAFGPAPPSGSIAMRDAISVNREASWPDGVLPPDSATRRDANPFAAPGGGGGCVDLSCSVVCAGAGSEGAVSCGASFGAVSLASVAFVASFATSSLVVVTGTSVVWSDGIRSAVPGVSVPALSGVTPVFSLDGAASTVSDRVLSVFSSTTPSTASDAGAEGATASGSGVGSGTTTGSGIGRAERPKSG
ncbi:hypothetical protein PARPLA_03240 [Rhodobacteraceae bacterium THAF1]|nr:hypothetical protein PARPLA_03240 [Rhodobacteraceae bacterium THAF1]